MITKNELRQINKKKRSAMTSFEVKQKSDKIAEQFLMSEIYKTAKTIMLYMPLGNEADTTAVIKKAYEDGKNVVFPVTDKKSGEITPVYSNSETDFSIGAFSISEPQSDSIASKKDIDVVIVPGIVFDKSGARIGFGKGCYDMFLKNMSVCKVGFCYDFQLSENIPYDEYDIKMDFIITNKEFINIKKK